MIPRPNLLPLVLCLSTCLSPARADLRIEASTWSALESAAHLVARGGRAEELREVVALMSRLGYAKESAQKLSGACEKELAAAKTRQKELPEAESRLASAARELSALLDGLEGPEKELVARAVLRLDDEVEAARKALGHERTPGGWARPEERNLLPRRTRILDMLRQAHELELEIQTEESRHEVLLAMHNGPGSVARFRRISVHTPWSAERTARVLAEALRACAVSAYLLDDEVGMPEETWFLRPGSTWILTDARREYDQGLVVAQREGWIDAETFEESKQLWGFHDRRGNDVSYANSEAEHAAAIFCALTPLEDGPQSALKAGHLSFVCQAYLGTPLPGFAWRPEPRRFWGETYVKQTAAEEKDLSRKLEVAKAGLPGARTWMSLLVRRGEDPPFARCIVDFFGKLSGEDLLKCTSMVEYWQERGTLRPLLHGLTTMPAAKALEAYAKSLGETPASLESRWRAWVVREEPCLAERLGRKDVPRETQSAEEELRLLLAGLRQKVLPATLKLAPLEIDPELSIGCRAHAEYLAQNPELAARWPEVHSEFANKPGYSAAGAWAAAHGIVSAARPSLREVFEAWMGSYYHRLPLLDPGLVRAGYGANKSFVVLDVYSLRRPAEASWAIVWPHEEMTRVPLLAVPELPNPVPQADQATLGYPITLQLGLPEPGDPPVSIEMHLWEGNKELECWYTSPDRPLNPKLVPARSYGLIPKLPLRPGVRYQVTAEWLGTTRKKSWFFRT